MTDDCENVVLVSHNLFFSRALRKGMAAGEYAARGKRRADAFAANDRTERQSASVFRTSASASTDLCKLAVALRASPIRPSPTSVG